MLENADLEILLDKTKLPFKKLFQNMWQVAVPSDNVHNVIINYQSPLIIIRLKLQDVKNESQDFYKKLLQMNATDITHGAFALEDNSLILIDSLETDNLDLNELVSSIQSITYTARHCYKELVENNGISKLIDID